MSSVFKNSTQHYASLLLREIAGDVGEICPSAGCRRPASIIAILVIAHQNDRYVSQSVQDFIQEIQSGACISQRDMQSICIFVARTHAGRLREGLTSSTEV